MCEAAAGLRNLWWAGVPNRSRPWTAAGLRARRCSDSILTETVVVFGTMAGPIAMAVPRGVPDRNLSVYGGNQDVSVPPDYETKPRLVKSFSTNEKSFYILTRFGAKPGLNRASSTWAAFCVPQNRTTQCLLWQG